VVAAATMFSRIRKRADLENTAYIDDHAEIGPLCEESYFELWDILISLLGDEGPWERLTVNTTANTETIAIPEDEGIYRVLRVDFRPSAGLSFIPIIRGNLASDPLDSVARPWGAGVSGPRYYARRSTRMGGVSPNYFSWNFYFDPIPAAVYPVRITFVPPPPVVAAGGSYVSFPEEWPEFVIPDVCAKLAAKQESDPAPFEAERERVRQRIERYAKPHNQAGPSFISNQRAFQPNEREDIQDGFWERR